MVSKLTYGNTYVLKQRDGRGVVVALYILDPARVVPLVTPSGDVYYELRRDDLAGLPDDAIIVPASEMIHDRHVALFPPFLVGVSPIYACGLAASQGSSIQDNSTRFFANGSNPGGVITVPGKIAPETADRVKADWQAKFAGNNVGKVALLSENMQYKPLSVNPVDAQLIEQLKWTTETICACYHVPASLIDASHPVPYANSEPLVQQYYSQCLHRTKAASETIRSGALSPDEARAKYFGLGKVKGGDTPYLQQQMFSLAALAERDSDDPFAKPAPPPPAAPANADDPPPEPPADDLAKLVTAIHTKAIAEGLYAA
jgi:phage portal protein BeeE